MKEITGLVQDTSIFLLTFLDFWSISCEAHFKHLVCKNTFDPLVIDVEVFFKIGKVGRHQLFAGNKTRNNCLFLPSSSNVHQKAISAEQEFVVHGKTDQNIIFYQLGTSFNYHWCKWAGKAWGPDTRYPVTYKLGQLVVKNIFSKGPADIQRTL